MPSAFLTADGASSPVVAPVIRSAKRDEPKRIVLGAAYAHRSSVPLLLRQSPFERC